MTLGGRRVAVSRPRMRSVKDDRELALDSYEHFADRDPPADLVFERIMTGTSARSYERANEPVGSELGEEASSTSRSAVSRAFVERTP